MKKLKITIEIGYFSKGFQNKLRILYGDQMNLNFEIEHFGFYANFQSIQGKSNPIQCTKLRSIDRKQKVYEEFAGKYSIRLYSIDLGVGWWGWGGLGELTSAIFYAFVTHDY